MIVWLQALEELGLNEVDLTGEEPSMSGLQTTPAPTVGESPLLETPAPTVGESPLLETPAPTVAD